VTPSGSDPVDALPLADLQRVVSALVAQVATLQETVVWIGAEAGPYDIRVKLL
jgi:hypothetical protein